MLYLIFAILLSMGSTNSALANPAPEARLAVELECTIIELRDGFSAFLPPQVGDRIVIDTARESISALPFSNSNSIPVLVPLRRNIDPAVPMNSAAYAADQYETTFEKGRLVLILSAHNDEASNIIYRGIIQQVVTLRTGEVLLDTAVLKCQPT